MMNLIGYLVTFWRVSNMNDEQRLMKLHKYMMKLKFDCDWEFHNVNEGYRKGQGIFIDIFNYCKEIK